MTTSVSILAWQDKRRPSTKGRSPSKPRSTSVSAHRLAALDVRPCLGKSPSDTTTWQRPQMPRPPQTESMSTPKERAACNTGVPMRKRPRRPEGVKTISASFDSLMVADGPLAGAAAAGVAATTTRGAIGTGRWVLTELANPTGAIGVVAHHDVGTHDGANHLFVQGVGDG